MNNTRTWFVLLFAICMLAALWGLKEHPGSFPKVQEALKKKVLTYEERRAKATTAIQSHREAVQHKVVKVDLSSLQGRKLGGLYATYLGLPKGELVPKSVSVSFEERMASMYHEKVEYKKCSKVVPIVCTVATDTVLSHAPSLLERYIQSDKMRMDLPRFIAIAEERVERGRRSLDWGRLCKGYRLDSVKCALLTAIISNINGKDLIAYGMTELLPSDDGRLNVKYLDLLLRNAGAEFVYHVPALGDRYASLGFYQFTFFALRADDSVVAGVSRVNTFVKKGGDVLPGSVVLLSGHQHHTAAFYFAVHNIAFLLARLNENETAALASIHEKQQGAMVVIIAAAHHHPPHTIKAVRAWLSAIHVAQKPSKKGKKQVVPNTNLLSYFPETADMRQYAHKSFSNLSAVYTLGH